MYFPLWQYLTQPVFCSKTPLILNPLHFWQNYRLQNLELCWEIDPVQQLELCWARDLEEANFHRCVE